MMKQFNTGKYIIIILCCFVWGSLFSQSKLIFLSDTQEPLWIEKLFIKTANNSLATASIFSNILSEQNADAVFHLGDLTPLGSFEWEWNKIDGFVSRLKKRNIPFYPLMGNHEYMLFSSEGVEKYEKRFGGQKANWYSVRIAECEIIMLNSNFNKLTKAENALQEKWYKNKITQLERDASVKSVIVCLHHSPYTNSKVVKPSIKVQEKFVPLFINSPKCRLFISGHAHAFEHFRMKGKDFIVTGGGGGALQPLLAGDDRRYDDCCKIKRETGFFHYLQCRLSSGKVMVTVKKLNDDFKTFSDYYKIDVE